MRLRTALFVLSLLLSAPAWAVPYVATGDVNLREKATGSSAVIGLVKKGQTVDYIKKANNHWSSVTYQGKAGFVSTAYITPKGSEPGPTPPTQTTWEKKADQVISYGKVFLGAKYQYGAKPYYANKTFDCSSFTQHIMKNSGVSLPRDSRQQSAAGTAVAIGSVRKGDLIFFKSPEHPNSTRINHVAVYIGNGSIIHTASNPKGVHVAPLAGHWRKHAVKARRVIR